MASAWGSSTSGDPLPLGSCQRTADRLMTAVSARCLVPLMLCVFVFAFSFADVRTMGIKSCIKTGISIARIGTSIVAGLSLGVPVATAPLAVFDGVLAVLESTRFIDRVWHVPRNVVARRRPWRLSPANGEGGGANTRESAAHPSNRPTPPGEQQRWVVKASKAVARVVVFASSTAEVALVAVAASRLIKGWGVPPPKRQWSIFGRFFF